MTKLVIYEDEEQQPIVRLKLMSNGINHSNDIFLCVVDSQGNILSQLITFNGRNAIANLDAKSDLEKNGIDTSFCKWTERGEIRFV